MVFGHKFIYTTHHFSLKLHQYKHLKKYTFYETRRWDLETINKKIIKLPVKNYNRSLISYLEIKNKNDFTKYKVFDYRLENQLILK